MKKMEPRQGHGAKAKEGKQAAPTSISQIVRIAEKYVAEGRFGRALEQLAIARSLDPQNQYINAIIQRVQTLERTAAPQQSDRYLSVTIGKEYEQGIRGREDESLSPEEVRMRVRELTDAAGILLNRGLSESAFETLMKAYLLDPVSPDVLACEKSVLPAWELFRKQRTDLSVQVSRMRELNASSVASVRQNLEGPSSLRGTPPMRGGGRKHR